MISITEDDLEGGWEIAVVAKHECLIGRLPDKAARKHEFSILTVSSRQVRLCQQLSYSEQRLFKKKN